MIVCGYPGIGKTTLVTRQTNKDFIDLESSNFNDRGTTAKPEFWYEYYCNIAADLSRQGYIVLCSCHNEVRDEFIMYHSDHDVYVICPDKSLKYEWGKKLLKRYSETHEEGDYRAYAKHDMKFFKNLEDIETCGLPVVKLTSMDYDLEKIVYALKLKGTNIHKNSSFYIDNI